MAFKFLEAFLSATNFMCLAAVESFIVSPTCIASVFLSPSFSTMNKLPKPFVDFSFVISSVQPLAEASTDNPLTFSSM